MFRANYAEIVEDDPSEARRREREAFGAIIQKLQTSARSDRNVAMTAIGQLEDLWKILLDDLSHPDNGLPENLRSDLTRIGAWTLAKCASVRSTSSNDFSALIDINSSIRDGLR